MSGEYILVEQSGPLKGEVKLIGAKNAVLVIMASLILTSGKSILKNVPNSEDVLLMIELLKQLGADIIFDVQKNILEIDTKNLNSYKVSPEIMKKMRASILVMGPLLTRFGKAEVALPGGCRLGARPINYHLKAFINMGASAHYESDYILITAERLAPIKFVLDYPSVGATENILMAATLVKGKTKIVNAALEPEVLDLIRVLTAMGSKINIYPPATIEIEGVDSLNPIEHSIIFDRLEAGSLILAAAATGGEIYLPQAPAFAMEVFLEKLTEMGHFIEIGHNETGIKFKATKNPQSISPFKTMPYPGFPTDLQAPMMTALCLSSGTSSLQETVFENRLLHVRELQKMGAEIKVEGDTAIIKGVEQLYGSSVIASDIRASIALVIAGLVAEGETRVTGVHHLKRGYDNIIEKLQALGARISIKSE